MLPPPPASPGLPAVAVVCEQACTLDATLTAPPSAVLRVAAGTRGPGRLAWVHAELDAAAEARTAPLVATALGRRLVGDGAPGRITGTLRVRLSSPGLPDVEARSVVVMGKARPYPLVVGVSVRGEPLVVHLPDVPTGTLVMGAIHGDEPQGAWGLVRALGRTAPGGLRAAVLVVANPDGYARRTRRDAHDVDLNRNFPGRTWGTGLHPGRRPASEPETRAVLRLLRRLDPRLLLTLHADQALVEDPVRSRFAWWLARRTALPLRRSVGYATPGSLGDWAQEHGLHEVTLELPAGPPDAGTVAALTTVLAGRAPR